MRDGNVMATMNGSWVEFPRARTVRAWSPRWESIRVARESGILAEDFKARPDSGY